MTMPLLYPNVTDNETPGIAIAIMSPDQFWCQGIYYVAETCLREKIVIHYCHNLVELRKALMLNNISTLLTEECGMGESLVDWLKFRQWSANAFPKLHIVKLQNSIFLEPDKGGVNPEVLSLAATINEFRYLLYRINFGMLQSSKVSFNRPYLTERELYVLQCLCRAETPNKIGRRLGLSTRTISGHKMSALKKLGLKSLSRLLGGDTDLRCALTRCMPD